jgi:hypothetical protein
MVEYITAIGGFFPMTDPRKPARPVWRKQRPQQPITRSRDDNHINMPQWLLIALQDAHAHLRGGIRPAQSIIPARLRMAFHDEAARL